MDFFTHSAPGVHPFPDMQKACTPNQRRRWHGHAGLLVLILAQSLIPGRTLMAGDKAPPKGALHLTSVSFRASPREVREKLSTCD